MGRPRRAARAYDRLLENPLSLGHYVRAVRRQAWLVAVALAVVLGSAALLLAVREPVYRASMKIVVGQGGGVFRPDAGGSVDSFTQTMTNLLESRIVAERAIDTARMPTTADELLAHLHVSTEPQSSVLSVTYDAMDRTEAVRALAAVGLAFRELLPHSLSGGTQVTASVFDPPHAASDRVSPHPARTLVIAALLGLVVGMILVVARETLRPRVRGVAEAEEAFGAPVLGAVPSQPCDRGPALDALAANVRFGGLAGAGRVVVVTSPLRGDGRSTVAASLGAALRLAEDVICVEADAGRGLSSRLGAGPAALGLVDVLLGRCELDRALVGVAHGDEERGAERPRAAAGAAVAAPSRVTGLRLLPLGEAGAGLAAALTPDAAAHLMGALRDAARYVVVDAPPLLEGAGARALAANADALIVVALDGRTTMACARAVRDVLERRIAVSAGVVLLGSRELVPERWSLVTPHG
jgi:capsular polysaccharide biosynthesis protein/MinD-like ATPase involved in chromosome partitioning or flagellar assembly